MKPDNKTPAKATGNKGGKDRGKPRAEQRDMGLALRSVYQQTVEEKIPDDLLDLLGKLD